MNLPLTSDMQPSTLMSRMLGLLPVGHEPCFFLQAAFLKHVRAHFVHDKTSNPLTLALCTEKIFQRCVSSTFTVNHIYSAPFLGDEFPVHDVHPQASSCFPCSSTPGPSSHCAPVAPSASHHYNSHSLCWYHRSHGDQAQKWRSPCSWSGN